MRWRRVAIGFASLAVYTGGLVGVAQSGDGSRQGQPPVAALTAINRLAAGDKDQAVDAVSLAVRPVADAGALLPFGATLNIEQASWRQRGNTASVVVAVARPQARRAERRTLVMVKQEGKWRALFTVPARRGPEVRVFGAPGPKIPGGPCDGLQAVGPAAGGNTVPVILVPGAGTTDQGFGLIAGAAVRSPGAALYEFDQPARGAWVTDPSIGPRLAAAITCIAGTTSQRAVVVGHSTGALALRSALAQPGVAAHVQAAVAIAEPANGAPALVTDPATVTASDDVARTIALERAACDQRSRVINGNPVLCTLVSEDGTALGRALRPGSPELAALPPWPAGLPRYAIDGDVRAATELLSAYRTPAVPVGDTVSGPLPAATDGADRLVVSCIADIATAFAAPCAHDRLLANDSAVKRTLAVIVAAAKGDPLPGPVPASQYVAIGDSYASGEGAGPFDATGGCRRSDQAWPRLVGPLLATELRQASSVVHLACSGATTADVVDGGRRQLAGIPPVAAGVPTTVTVMIGGNNGDVLDLLGTCLIGVAQGSSCADSVAAAVKRPLPELFAEVQGAIVDTFVRVSAAAPGARVVAVTYPRLFGDIASSACLGLSARDLDYLQTSADQLDDTVVAAAQQAGVEVIDLRDAFAGHGVCAGLTAMVNGLPVDLRNPTGAGAALGALQDQTPFHPNSRGYAQMAELVSERLSASERIDL